MTEDAHAVVIHGAGDVRVEERPFVAPQAGTAEIQVALGGICGSDISYYKNGAVGSFKVTSPMILGHEVIGNVGEIGASVTGIESGDRIAVDPSSPCGKCDRCKEGRSNICLAPNFLGSASTQPHTDGGFASSIITRAQNIVPLADHLEDRLAVFAEPLAVSVHAVERAGGVKGARVLILGAGPIGGMISALCVHLGAAEVVAADIEPSRLETATELGVHQTFQVGEQDVGSGYDIVFDATGAAPAISDALTRVRRGGALVLVGLPHGGPVSMPINLSITGEVDVYGSFRFNHDEFERSVQYLTEGLDLSPLISNTYHSHHASDAFVEASSGNALKVQLDFRGGSDDV